MSTGLLQESMGSTEVIDPTTLSFPNRRALQRSACAKDWAKSTQPKVIAEPKSSQLCTGGQLSQWVTGLRAACPL